MEYKKIIFVSLLFSLISLMCIFVFAQGVGYIQIKCEPGATVFLDNKFMGTTSSELGGLILQDVPAGSHEVKMVKEGFKPQSVKIDIKANEIYLYEVSLKQISGSLLIETLPIDCIIEIPKLNIDKEHNGNKIEKTWEVSDIPIGNYRINFLALGKKVKYDLEIEEGVQKHLLVNILNNEVKEILPTLTWDKTYGGNVTDWAYSLIQTTDGGYAVAGYTYFKGAGGADFWVIKLDKQGNKVWDKTYGGSGGDGAYSLIQTTDGGYAVAGDTSSKGAGGADFWVIKLDKQGNKVWDKTYGVSGEDWAYSLIQTTDGGYAVAGNTSSKGTGGWNFWVIKLNEQGEMVWDKTYGGSGEDWANSLIQTTDGGYAVAGYTTSKGAGKEDAWVVKLDSKGNIIWDKTFGGSKYDEANSLIQTTDGGYAVAGYTTSKGAGAHDFWVIKLDEQGNLISDVSKLDYETKTGTETNTTSIQTIPVPSFDSYQWEVGIPGLVKPGEITKFEDTTISTESSPQISETTYFLTGSLHCPEKGGYPCAGCGPPPDYKNYFKGFNVLTTNEDCYVKLIYNNGDYIGNQNNCEVTIKGEKWLGLKDESGTELVEEINNGRFNFKPANKFVERTMNFPGDNYKYEFVNEGKEFRLYLSRNREEAFKAVPWQNITVEIKNKETNKVFKYKFEKGIFPLTYSWSNGGMANYGQCIWWTAKRWVEEVDSETLFLFYPPSPEAVNVKTINSNYQPKKYDVLINYDPKNTSELGHYGFVEKVDADQVYITQFNWLKPGEVYNHVLRPWNGNAKGLYYSNNPSDLYYFKYYYRK